ncbi:MAG: FecR family protein [Pseudomonadota bacterium]
MKRLAVFFLGFLLTQAVYATGMFGMVDIVSGTATVTDKTGANQPVHAGMEIYSRQSIQTGADGEVHIVTEDGGFIALRPNTSFRVDRYQAKGEASDEVVFSLLKGALRSITGWVARKNPLAYRLNTPTATIGVRGTDHETTVIATATYEDQAGTFDTVYEGATVMQTDQGDLDIHAGEYAFAALAPGIAPRLLERPPGFVKLRKLMIEGRIQHRKEYLKRHIQNRLQDKTGTRREENGEGIQGAKERREAIKQRKELRRMREPRN